MSLDEPAGPATTSGRMPPAAKTGRRLSLPLVVLLIVAFLAGGYAGWRWLNKIDAPNTIAASAATPPAPAPIPVIASMVRRQDFPIVLSGVGTVTALNSATVRSMVTEQIVSIDFTDGQIVKKGQLLAQLDPTTLQAQLDQAQANLTRDQAHLGNGEINLNRYVPLAKQGFAAQSILSRPRMRKFRPRSRQITRRSITPRLS